jgi:hypothetical protein
MPELFVPKHSRLNLFSTLSHKPEGITFVEQEADEQVILFVRKDFITNAPWIFMTVFFTIIPFILPFLFKTSGLSFSFLSTSAVFVITAFYYLIIAGFAFTKFITWFYGIGIVTSKRTVDIDLYNVSYINVAATGLQDLKNVEYIQRGFFQSFFDYGDVSLTVEAAGEKLVFEQIPEPARVVNIISSLIGEK